MPNRKPPGSSVAGATQPPGDPGLILDGIRFMERELRIPSAELPPTHEGAKRRYGELRAKLRPPTPGQVAHINRLVGEVGGTASGKLHSHRHAALLIEELNTLRTTMREDAGPEWPRLRPMVLSVGAGAFAGLFLRPRVAVSLLLLAATLVFAVGRAFHLLGRWGETFSILFRRGAPGE